MAESKNVMARIARLERDGDSLKRIQVQTADILVDLSERLDRVRTELRGEMQELRGEMRELRESLEARLDRLIAVTTQERTHSIERFADLERRVARLEAREP